MLPFGLQTVHICFNLQTGSASNLTICVGQLGKKFVKYYNHTLGEANHGANTVQRRVEKVDAHVYFLLMFLLFAIY